MDLGAKMSKLILSLPLWRGLKSYPIPAPPSIWGGENPHGVKQGGVDQGKVGKIFHPDPIVLNNFPAWSVNTDSTGTRHCETRILKKKKKKGRVTHYFTIIFYKWLIWWMVISKWISYFNDGPRWDNQ